MQLPQVLIFDSGVGGLSIAQEIRRQISSCSLTYVSDNAFFPYGTKNEVALINRVHQVLDKSNRLFQPDIIVVACNTASTLALPRIREFFEVDIVGVVPAIKPAAALSQSKVLGLLGTPGTVQRNYTKQLITDFAQDCHIIPVGSSELVEIAEKKLRGKTVDCKAIQNILNPFFVEPSPNSPKLDTIILACTHFPLLRDELDQSIPYPVQWVDSGAAIARRVKDLLRVQGHSLQVIDRAQTKSISAMPSFQSIFTKKNSSIEELLPQLEFFLTGPVSYIDVD